jgi:hypothetical protein
MHRLNYESLELEETNQLMDSVFHHVHAYILLIDGDFVVLKTNYYMLTGTMSTFDKKRVGDLLHCRNAMCSAGGCGTGELCATCPIRAAIQQALDTHSNFENLEASLNVIVGDDARIVEITASVSGKFFLYRDKPRMVLTIHDITELKKARMLQSNT